MRTSPVRTLVRLTVANRVSAAYLVLVAVVVAKATADSLVAEDPDPDYAWIWPPLVTFPAFPLVAALGRTVGDTTELPDWSFITMIVISALLQSLALGSLAQAIRTRHQRMIRSC
ncbi:hypothetical protein ABZ357_05400 [Streptomyces sp. NPDC005917]|uniref:SCO4225 family membrane protein n=1 Tax=unclassified Streptomyces TaxID=2593676 RepID=UPI0033DBE6A8